MSVSEKMVANHVTTGIFTVLVLVSAVHNLKVITGESKPRAMLSQIVQNISRVNNLLVNFIKHFEQMEENAKEETDQSAEVVSDVKDIFDVYQVAKSEKNLQKPPINEKNGMRKHGDDKNNDGIDKNVITFKFKTSANNLEVREFPIEISRDSSAAEIVRENRRVNKNLPDEKEYMSIELPKKNKTKIQTEVNMPTTSDKAPQTINNPERSAIQDSNSEDDKLMQDEILKAKTLRQAYDEACKKVIKRKCNKVLDAVLKDVCNPKKRKCTETFKKDFKDNGVTGCDKQFDKKATHCRMGHDDSELGENAAISELDINDNTKFLRTKLERYEKECKKANYRKGLAACKYAVDETCEEHECLESKKETFDKSCQKRCKENYGIGDSDSSDDESDDEDPVGWDST